MLSARPVTLHYPFPKHLTSCPEDEQVGGRPHSLSFSFLLETEGSDSAWGVSSLWSEHEGLCLTHLRSSAGIPNEAFALVKGGQALLLGEARMPSLLPALWKLPACLARGMFPQLDIDQRVNGVGMGDDWHSTAVPGT